MYSKHMSSDVHGWFTFNIFVKRLIDIMISVIAIIMFSPLFCIISLAIKLDSKGPVFFKQGRLTRNGKVFTMYKFRTMIENAEYMGTGLYNYENDFRVTRVGLFLRRTSLDEIPQLFNILKGEMSLIGPRPPVYYELGNYEELTEIYKKRFTILPGITGLAQVKGRNELPWDEKVKFDNHYIDLFQKYGVFIDAKIFVLTIINVFKMKNIYEVKEEAVTQQDKEDEKVKAHSR